MPIYGRFHPQPPLERAFSTTALLTRDDAWASARWTSMAARQLGRVAPQQQGGDQLSDQPVALVHATLSRLLKVLKRCAYDHIVRV